MCCCFVNVSACHVIWKFLVTCAAMLCEIERLSHHLEVFAHVLQMLGNVKRVSCCCEVHVIWKFSHMCCRCWGM